MKTPLSLATLVCVLGFTGAAAAQEMDMGKLVDAVDKDKAVESVNTEQVKEAVSGGEVDYKKAYDAVDKDKAKESVDMEKVKEAMGAPGAE